MIRLYGKPVRIRLENEILDRIAKLPNPEKPPILHLFSVEGKSDSAFYCERIVRSAERLGIGCKMYRYSPDVTEDILSKDLLCSSLDPNCNGMLLLRPLPKHLDCVRLCSQIPAEKDVDGANPNLNGFAPCAAAACVTILEDYGISVRGKRCTVVGRSELVGKPLGRLLAERGGLVQICHSQTSELCEQTVHADLLFLACGQGRMIDERYVRSGQTVIDVGFHSVAGEVYGDADEQRISPIVAAYTPVPGGIGTVTVPLLLLNTVIARERTFL